MFHCGVLYHLTRPIEHLFTAAGMCSFLFLDTHVAPEEEGRERVALLAFREQAQGA